MGAERAPRPESSRGSPPTGWRESADPMRLMQVRPTTLHQTYLPSLAASRAQDSCIK
jgi:hypothetical protein